MTCPCGRAWLVAAVVGIIMTGVVVVLSNASPAPDTAPPERTARDFIFIDNGEIRMGFKKSSGVAIASFQTLPDGENVINHWDRGRLVQQSYYGETDGSTWTLEGKIIPWRWNPVQGGDWQHNPPVVLDVKAQRDRLYSKSVGRNWGGCQDLPEVVFEQWATLKDQIAHVKFQITYSGETTHPAHSQELPAVFIEPHYNTLVVYDGDQPWTGAPVSQSIPGWPNESRKISENWAAYLGHDGIGIGVYVPVASDITCYRFGAGKYRREDGACSYFAPVKTFAITPGMVFNYDVYMTIGTKQEIRDRFYEIRKHSFAQN